MPARTGLSTLIADGHEHLIRGVPGSPVRRPRFRTNHTGKDQVGSLADLSTASPLKLLVSRVVASDQAGRLIGALSGNRVRHHGLWFDVRSSDFTPQVRAQMFWGGGMKAPRPG
jgi:hypothetical protein